MRVNFIFMKKFRPDNIVKKSLSTRLKLVSFKEQQKTWNELKWPVKVIGWPPEALSRLDSHCSLVSGFI